MAGSAFVFSRKLTAAATSSDDAIIEVMLDEPLGTISPLIYSHFTEELGAVIYNGVWVGEKSKIANTGGYDHFELRVASASRREILGPGKGRPTVAPHISPKQGEIWGTRQLLLELTGGKNNDRTKDRPLFRFNVIGFLAVS